MKPKHEKKASINNGNENVIMLKKCVSIRNSPKWLSKGKKCAHIESAKRFRFGVSMQVVYDQLIDTVVTHISNDVQFGFGKRCAEREREETRQIRWRKKK